MATKDRDLDALRKQLDEDINWSKILVSTAHRFARLRFTFAMLAFVRVFRHPEILFDKIDEASWRGKAFAEVFINIIVACTTEELAGANGCKRVRQFPHF